MVATPRAEQLVLPRRRTLAEMEQAPEPETFAAGEATRRLVLAVNNYVAIVLAPSLVAAVAAAAPAVQLDLRPSGTLEVFNRLDSGEVETAIGTFDRVGEGFQHAALLEDRHVAVLRQRHPAARGSCRPRRFPR
jgi:DNA-binding transcriptional LysR family regulator